MTETKINLRRERIFFGRAIARATVVVDRRSTERNANEKREKRKSAMNDNDVTILREENYVSGINQSHWFKLVM